MIAIEEFGSGIAFGFVKGGNNMLPLEALPKQLPATGVCTFPSDATTVWLKPSVIAARGRLTFTREGAAGQLSAGVTHPAVNIPRQTRSPRTTAVIRKHPVKVTETRAAPRHSAGVW